MTREECAKLLAYLQLGAGARPVSREQSEVYFDFLKDLDFATAKLAAKLALAESQYPTLPPVGVLLKHAGASPVGLTVDTSSRALIAYAAASKAVHTHGAYRSVDFSDPLTNAVIRQMGGWERFCGWNTEEIQWRQRDFERHYAALSSAGVSGELCAGLGGICEAVNGGIIPGQEPSKIGVNLPAPARAIVQGEIPVKALPVPASQSQVKRLVAQTGEKMSERVQYPPADRPKPKEPEPVPELTAEEFELRRLQQIKALKQRSAMEVNQ